MSVLLWIVYCSCYKETHICPSLGLNYWNRMNKCSFHKFPLHVQKGDINNRNDKLFNFLHFYPHPKPSRSPANICLGSFFCLYFFNIPYWNVSLRETVGSFAHCELHAIEPVSVSKCKREKKRTERCLGEFYTLVWT